MVELSCETLRKTSTDDSGVLGFGSTIGAVIIRIGFWNPLYYDYNKEPPKIVWVIIWASTLF